MSIPFTNPSVQESLNTVTYDWPEYKLRIKADRIEQSGKSELWFYHVNGKGEELLHTGYFNLMASSTMTTLAKRMQDHHSDEIPWHEMITYLTAKTIQIARRGEPLEELWTHEDTPPPTFLLFPFIVENYANIIFGDPGTMKSTLALIFSQLVLRPWEDNPLGIDVPQHSIPVLYLDWETDSKTIRFQLKSIANGARWETTTVSYRRCNGTPLAKDLEAISAKIQESKAQLVIIDSLGLACGGDLNGNEDALAFFAALRHLKVTSLILAHNSKGGEGNKKSVYGSMFFHAQARNIWEIRKSQADDSNIAAICLFHAKAPPFSGLQKPRAFELDFSTPNQTKVKVVRPDNFSEFTEKMSVTTQILLALRGGSMSVKELQDDAGIDSANIYVELSRLRKKGIVVKVDNNRWGLLTPDPENG